MTVELEDEVEQSAAMSNLRRAFGWLRRRPLESWIGLAVVAGCVVFVGAQIQFDLVLARTTPAGGDMGAHVWGPAFLRDELLPNLRLTGWSNDWYSGFPVYQFYMLPPALLTLALDLVLPYGIALKLVTVSGVLALPACAYAMGRLMRLSFPGPPLLAVATVPFLFDRTWTIYGGNVPSTLAGEYSFSISLALSLLFFGVLARALETGRYRGWATCLLALTILCHAIPAFFAVAGGTVLVLMYPNRERIRFAAPIVVLGMLLTAFWSVPFVLRRGLLTDMGWETIEEHGKWLMPEDMRWVIVLALVGLVLSLSFAIRAGIFFAAVGVLFGLGFVLDAAGPVNIWNARLLPFLYLSYYLLAAVGVSEVVRSLAVIFDGSKDRRRRGLETAGVVVALGATLVVVGLPLRSLPFGKLTTNSDLTTSYEWMGISTKDDSFVDSWATWNYSGYERKAAYPEYRDLVQTMIDVGEDRGCGRAHWEYDEDINRFGTPMALMLLPFWSDGCIGSSEGLYFESSGTTPFHFLNASEVSPGASNPVRNEPERPMPYSGFNLDLGVAHMRLLGMKYYMAFSDQAVSAASTHADLTEVATSGPWHVYEIADSAIVAPLANEPAVLEGMSHKNPAWQRDAIAWYMNPGALDVVLAPDGPDEWQRIDRGDDPERRPLPATTVSNVEVDDLEISFDVDEVGAPILVKTSWFPNWKVSGADGPYRVTPNLMVVIPTDEHVELTYGYTKVEYLGYGVSALALIGLVLLVRRGPRRFATALDDTLFPDSLDQRGFADPTALAICFADELLGIDDPEIVEATVEDHGQRCLEVRDVARPDRPPVVLQIERFSDKHWYVVSAASPSIKLRVPRTGHEASGPIAVEGTALGAPATMHAELHVDGAVEPVDRAELRVTLGPDGDLVGFAGTLPLTAERPRFGRVLVRAGDAIAMARVVLDPRNAIGGLPARAVRVGAPVPVALGTSGVAEGAAEAGQADEGAGDPPEDGRAGGSDLLDPYRDLGDDEPPSLGT